jgi:hypothetical protein
LVDAGVPTDALVDAGVPTDASVDAAVDASPPPGPGEVCGPSPDYCAPGLECWYLAVSGEYICTQPCSSPIQCIAYGPGACCVPPGFQTLETVCVPPGYSECSP